MQDTPDQPPATHSRLPFGSKVISREHALRQFKKAKLWLFKTKWRVAGLVLILLLILSGSIFWTHHRSTIPPLLKQNAAISDIPIFFPAKLPDGFQVDPHSVITQNGITTYTIKFDKNSDLTISQQAKPGNFDFSQLQGETQFTTRYGKAIISPLESATTATLVGDKTWVLLRSPDRISTDDMHTILNSLQPVN
jgi:hypothetical protein